MEAKGRDSTLGGESEVGVDLASVPADVAFALEGGADHSGKTIHTKRIEEEAFRTNFIHPLRNLERMERSIPKGRCERARQTVNEFLDDFLFKVNNGRQVAVYGRSPRTMKQFLALPFTYWGGNR